MQAYSGPTLARYFQIFWPRSGAPYWYHEIVQHFFSGPVLAAKLDPYWRAVLVPYWQAILVPYWQAILVPWNNATLFFPGPVQACHTGTRLASRTGTSLACHTGTRLASHTGTSLACHTGTRLASHSGTRLGAILWFLLAARIIPEYYNVRISISKCGYLNLATMVDFHLNLVLNM